MKCRQRLSHFWWVFEVLPSVPRLTYDVVPLTTYQLTHPPLVSRPLPIPMRITFCLPAFANTSSPLVLCLTQLLLHLNQA